MKKLTFLLLTFTILVSCRKEFARFQKSSNTTYTTQKKLIEIPVEITQPEQPNLIASTQDSYNFTEPSEVFRSENNATITRNTQIIDNGDRKTRKNVSPKQEIVFEKNVPSQHIKDTKVAQKHRKPVPLNSTIYTGFIILGIAIVLALVSLESLSLLFGLASIVILYVGFKKYFRRKKWRDIFR